MTTYKLRIETSDGHEVYSCNLLENFDPTKDSLSMRALSSDITNALQTYPHRRKSKSNRRSNSAVFVREGVALMRRAREAGVLE